APSSGTIDVHIPRQTAFAMALLRCYGTSSPAAGDGAGQASPRNFVASCGISSYTKDGERHSLRSENPWQSDAQLGDKGIVSVTFSWVLESPSAPGEPIHQAEADFAFQILGWGE